MEKYGKSVAVLLLALTLLSSIWIGIGFGFKSGISTGLADYVVLEGVAGNDYYDGRQYSYDVNSWATSIAGYPALSPGNWWFNANKSLRMGMTEYGEFATPTPNNAGIAYGANSTEWTNTESWAASPINPKYWMQGWAFYMNYTRAGILRCIQGYAIYSDTTTVEGGRKVWSWDGTLDPGAAGSGLTAGNLTTSGVQMLYDSARLAVARTTVVIRDGAYGEDVAQVTLTIIFNKDLKYAIIYKDVKILLDTKVLDMINDFAFQEKYEIDLARYINPSNQAYIHYYQNFDNTVYQHPLTGSNKYDVVQAFNPDRNYTFFASYWPNTTEYAVYSPLVPNLPLNLTRILNPGTAIPDIPNPPTGPGEPSTPWVTVQWRYNAVNWPNMLDFLAKDPNREIRFVEVAGMTDYNMGSSAYARFRALDLDAGDVANNVDTEIRYMLNNVFNPEDLKSIVGTDSNMNALWNGVGQTSLPADSLGAEMLAGLWASPWYDEPLGLLDKNDTSQKGTIPYGLSPFTGSYLETFNNTGKGTGTDTTVYNRTGLNNFAFNYYDAATTARSPPQPIAGGPSITGTGTTPYWYPSKDPLTQRWTQAWVLSPYDAVTWHPNGIISVGGPKANWLSRYFNDFNFAITREGTSASALVNGGTVTGSAPTSDHTKRTYDFFPLSTWNTATATGTMATFGYTDGYAVIAVARDVNGTRGISVYGWDARDTYWASAWTTQYLGYANKAWIPSGTVAIILKISYISGNNEPSAFTIVKDLGTITEFGTNRFATAYGYDAITGPTTWSGLVVPPALPPTGYYWWFAKLPTTSTACVDFDP